MIWPKSTDVLPAGTISKGMHSKGTRSNLELAAWRVRLVSIVPPTHFNSNRPLRSFLALRITSLSTSGPG
jgi:hypothetical protein